MFEYRILRYRPQFSPYRLKIAAVNVGLPLADVIPSWQDIDMSALTFEDLKAEYEKAGEAFKKSIVEIVQPPPYIKEL